MSAGVRITSVVARAYRFPTDAPEADGTLAWNATVLVVVEIRAGGALGLGYTYADAASCRIVDGILAEVLREKDAFGIPALWIAMVRAVRNLGWRGQCACAISAVDVALWDLKARLLGIPLARLFGQQREEVPIYGSGAFTSYATERLREQLTNWVCKDKCREPLRCGSPEPSGYAACARPLNSA